MASIICYYYCIILITKVMMRRVGSGISNRELGKVKASTNEIS